MALREVHGLLIMLFVFYLVVLVAILKAVGVDFKIAKLTNLILVLVLFLILAEAQIA